VSGGLRDAWEHLTDELWVPLADHASGDVTAPASLFSDLFVAADDFLSPPASESELEEAGNDPMIARDRFLALKGTDFASERAVVTFVEEVHNVVADYEIPGLVELYERLLAASISKFNLRYRVSDPFGVRFLLPGSFANIYEELRRVYLSDAGVAALLTDFEKAFDRYLRTEDKTDLKTCIAKASNYAEGVASVTAGNPTTGNTLGALAGVLTDWPHDKIRASVVDLYHFCCDYPGIRHAGSPAHELRALASRDLTYIAVALFGLTGYLSSGLDEELILGV
jgi:hypothetical protein